MNGLRPLTEMEPPTERMRVQVLRGRTIETGHAPARLHCWAERVFHFAVLEFQLPHHFILFSVLCGWALLGQVAGQGSYVYEGFEREPRFHPAGDARVERVTRGAREGRGCLKVQFGGVKPGVRLSLIQAPNDPELGKRVQAARANGVRFWIRGDGSRGRVRFRIQWRNPRRLKDIRGASSALVYASSTNWRRVELAFEQLALPPGMAKWDSAAFEQFVPQIQFSRIGNQPYSIWLDQIEFTRVESKPVHYEPDLPGRDWLDRVKKEAERLAPEPTGRLTGFPGPEVRPEVCLNGNWHVLPVNEETKKRSRWQRLPVPRWYRDRKGGRAAWFVRRLKLDQAFAGHHLQVEFKAVYMYAEVFLNGRKIGQHAGGFTPFACEATAAARPGAVNTLILYIRDETYAVFDGVGLHQISATALTRSDLSPVNGRAGIWQDVFFRGYPTTFIRDIAVVPSFRRHSLEVAVEVSNSSARAQTVALEASCMPWKGGPAELDFSFSKVTVPAGKVATITVTKPWQNPRLWSPESPNLYWLEVRASQRGKQVDWARARFGFREFWIERDHFVLNGTPVRLRGDSNIARHSYLPLMQRVEYLRALFQVAKKETGFNAARVHASIGHPAVFEAADEVGVLLIDQSAIWSRGGAFYRRGGKQFLENTRKEFAEWVRRDRNHPSVVIWDVENEMVRGQIGNWSWARELDGYVLEHDRSRPVEHSGSGYCLGHASIYHIHHRENYTMLYEAWAHKRGKPLIAGEWWVGGNSGEKRLTTGEEFVSPRDYQFKELALMKERLDEQRSFGLAGILPFVWLTSYFEPVSEKPERLEWASPADPGIKPAVGSRSLVGWQKGQVKYRINRAFAECLRHGLSPFFVCFREKWKTCWSGEKLEKTLTLANDSEAEQEFRLTWWLSDGAQRTSHELKLNLKPAEIRHVPLELAAPIVEEAREISLHAELYTGGKLVNRDGQKLTVYPEKFPELPETGHRVFLYDPEGSTEKMLRSLGGQVHRLSDFEELDGNDLFVVGRNGVDARLAAAGKKVSDFVAAGGSVFCLEQRRPFDWLPYRIGFSSTLMVTPPAYRGFGLPEETRGINYSRAAVFQIPGHRVFDGIAGDRFGWWRFGDGRIADDVLLKPSAGPAPSLSPFRSLAGGTRPEYSSIGELAHGKGRFLLCQAHVSDNYGLDPAATRLFRNCVAYLLSGQQTGPRVLLIGAGLSTFFQKVLSVPARSRPRVGSVPLNADVIFLGPDVRPAPGEFHRLEQFLNQGGRVAWVCPERLPNSLGLKVVSLALKKKINYVAVAERSWLFGGLNAYDFSLWPEGPKHIIEFRKLGPRVLLIGGAVPVRTGAGSGFLARNMARAGAVACEAKVGKGSLIVTTVPLLDRSQPKSAAAWGAILMNLGIAAGQSRRAEAWNVARVTDVKIDGNLQEWISDMEDRNVTQWIHAPVHVLPSLNGHDRDASALAYLGVRAGKLYVAVQVYDDHPTEQDRLVVQLGGRALVCRWNRAGRPELSDSKGRGRSRIVAESLPAGESARNPDRARLGGMDTEASPRGRTLEFGVNLRALGLDGTAATLGRARLSLSYEDHDPGEPGAETLRYPPTGAAPLRVDLGQR